MDHIGKILLDYLQEISDTLGISAYSYVIPEEAILPFVVYEATNLEYTPDWYNNDNFIFRIMVYDKIENDAKHKLKDITKLIKKGRFIDKSDKGNIDLDPLIKSIEKVTYIENRKCYMAYQDFDVTVKRVNE